MSLLQPADLSGDDKRPTFGTAGLTLLIKCHRSHSSGAPLTARLCDASASHVYLFLLQACKKEKNLFFARDPGSFMSQEGFLISLYITFEAQRAISNACVIHTVQRVRLLNFATCEDSWRVWRKAEWTAVRAFGLSRFKLANQLILFGLFGWENHSNGLWRQVRCSSGC